MGRNMAAADPTTELESSATSTDSTVDESPATQSQAEGSRPGRKPDSAYRQLQSERDRARNEAQQAAQRQQATEQQIYQLRQQMDEMQFRAQLTGLEPDQQQVAVAQRQWDTLQRNLAAERQARAYIENQHTGLLTQSGRIGALAESIARHRPPAEVMGKPVLKFLMQHTSDATTVEEMDSLVAQVAAEFAKAEPAPAEQKAKSKAPAKETSEPAKPGGKYLGGEGTPSPPVTWSSRTKEDQAKRWAELKQGKRNFRSLND